MHDRHFDELSRVLGASLTRAGLLRAVWVLTTAGLAALGGTHRNGAAKNKKRKKKHRNTPNNCPQDKKNAVCHCPNGLGGAQCKINCVGTGGGHANDTFDCMCAGQIKGVPKCEPERCPEEFGERTVCGGPTICAGTCSGLGDCPYASVPGCRCNGATGQCEAACVPDGGTATFPIQCCSGTRCAATGRCGACTCEAACTVPADCTGLGVADCLCRTVDGQCGQCVPDGDPAGSAAACCSGALCADTGLCGACTTCTPACTVQSQCTGLTANCVCRTLAGQCGPCIVDGRPAGSGVECCSGAFCAATGRCRACACVADCATQAECAGLGVTDCVCHTLTGQCGACIPDGGAAGSAVECCGGSLCGTRCGLCPPQVCAGDCTSDAPCQAQADQCVCFAGGTCGECLGTGAACAAAGECCGQLKCLGGQCKISSATGGTNGKRSARGCTPAGRPCRLDGQCCAQSACFQGTCGEKNSHCHHNDECAKGYRCVGGRSIGDHRRCRKNGSKKYHHSKKKK